MYLIKKGNQSEQAAGTWWNTTGSSIVVRCPQCSKIAVVGSHEVAIDGTVTPSLVCPTEGCGFHEWVKLEEWK